MAASCAIFVWSGFVRAGLGFGVAVLTLPLLLAVDDRPLFWLPILALHLLIFSPPISPNSCCGRRKARCDTPYSRRPAKRSMNYARADLPPMRSTAHRVVRCATASFRRPRDVSR